MKSKLSWIPFIILTPVALFCKIAPHFFAEGSLFGKGSLVPDYVFLASCALIFLFSVLFCALDSRISPYYQPRRNVLLGVLGILTAICFAAEGALDLIRVFLSGKIEILPVIEGVLLVLSAVVMITMGLFVIFKGGEKKPSSIICVIPAILFAIRMISCFVSFTTISLRLADVTALCCYVFATMFFYHYAVSLSLIESKSGIKKLFIFGLPTAASMLAYGAVRLVFDFDTTDILANLGSVEMLLISLYIIVFLIEVSSHVVDRDSLNVIGPEDEEEIVSPDTKKENAYGFIVGVSGEDGLDQETSSSYLASTDTTDYLYREVKQDDSSYDDMLPSDTEDYLTKVVEDEEDDRPKDYESSLDEIDKLILEITEKID